MQWTSYDMLRVYFELIVKVWIQIQRANRSWIGLESAFENLIPLALVSENKTHGQQISNNPSIISYSRRRRVKLPIYSVSARFNSRWSLAPNFDHWKRSDLLETQLSGNLSDLNTINRVTHFLGSQSNQHQPLTTKSVHMQRLDQPPTLKDYLLLILSIYLAMTINANMMIKLLKLSRNIV